MYLVVVGRVLPHFGERVATQAGRLVYLETKTDGGHGAWG